MAAEVALARAVGSAIVMPGYVCGEEYWGLTAMLHAYAFTLGVSGPHPALLEAMACGNCVSADA